MRLYVVVLLAGCGRLHFDEVVALTTDAGDDAAVARPCGLSETAPPTITVSGQTFQYTSFLNASSPVAGVTVAASDASTGVTLANVTSASGGGYAFGVMTNGAPRRIAVRYATQGFFTTTAVTDLPLAESTLGGGQPLWTFGDAPIWSNSAMTMVYTAGGMPRDTLRGTLNIAVRDCAGAVVEGVTVELEPAPLAGALQYQAADGRPSPTATETIGPFGHVLVLNVAPGLTRIIATKAGRTFLDTHVTVVGGDQNMLATVRAVD